MSSTVFLEKLLDGADVEWRPILEVFHLKNGYTPSKSKQEFWEDGTVPWFRMDDIRQNGRILSDSLQKVSESGVKGGKLFPANSIIVATTATIGEHALIRVPFLANQQFTVLNLRDEYIRKLDIKFLFYFCFLLSRWCKQNTKKSSFPSVNMNGFRKFKFPIPFPDNPEKSLAIQGEIVRILDTFMELTTELTTELTARKKQYEYYREKLLTFDDADVEWRPLGEVAEFCRGTAITKMQSTDGDIPVVANGPVPTYFHGEHNREGETVVVARSGAYAGYVSYWNRPIFLTDAFSIHPQSKVIQSRFVYYLLQNKQGQIHAMKKGAGVPHVRVKEVQKYDVPIPSLAEQQRIVSILDKFDALTTSLTEGLPREIELRQKQYEYYRDLLLNFPKPEKDSA
ncbi:MAG: restriction endonuclease subunit S [Gammaproteobacteria bacterium]|nr:restriction endonuclease subunit S [Gammaproteobacteria bacterium]